MACNKCIIKVEQDGNSFFCPKCNSEAKVVHRKQSNHFRENIRTYNSTFSFTSMGGKVDASVNQWNWSYNPITLEP
ncbi:hypothetical protein P3S68_005937 [Capsicum galapagoense]